VSPEECVKVGDLSAALAQLQARVRAAPSVPSDRVFLFQLLALLGQWSRAKTQLSVAGELDPSLLLTVNAYGAALDAEEVRSAVFRGERAPLVLGEPPAWLAPLLEASRLTALGHHAAAAELRATAFEQAATVAGEMDGTAFEWLADADSRLGPCLEIFLEGRYYWVPFERIREIKLEAPGNLRDLVWMPAQVEWSNRGRAPVFIPTRYAGTETADDDRLRLARATRWSEPAEGTQLGLGQRVFATDAAETGVCDARLIRLNVTGDAATDDPPGSTDG